MTSIMDDLKVTMAWLAVCAVDNRGMGDPRYGRSDERAHAGSYESLDHDDPPTGSSMARMKNE